MTREAFRFETLSPQPLRGKTAPVEAFLVLGPEAYPVRVRYRAAASVEVRMIGREAEMAQLNDALGKAQEMRAPQFVLISGEPGIGKSRLLFEFSRRVELDSQHSLLFSARARAENARAPFLFWESLWTNRLKIMKDEPDSARREKFVCGVLDMWGNRLGPLTAVEVAHTLGYLIGMDWPDSPYLESLRNDSPALSARVVALTAELFSRAAGVGSAVIMLDDLQHADTSSLNLFEALLNQPNLPLLIVGASRQAPDALRPDGGGRQNVSHLVLRPLSLDEDNIGEIFQRAKTLPAAFRRRLAARADGSPYFLEEMVKALLQTEVIVSRDENWFLRDEGESESIPLPDSLRAQLQARLDAVSPEARAVAMTASVIGRTFWVSLVELLLSKTTFTSTLTPPSDNNWASRIAGALDELQGLELVFERVGNSTFVGQPEFIFKNNLLRETAYGLLPRKYRYQYHALVADWLVNRSLPDYTLAAAEHYELGGQAAQAAQFYRKAADHLTGRGLDSEARSARQAAERLEATPLKQTGALIPSK
jgi:adenylate cyclase